MQRTAVRRRGWGRGWASPTGFGVLVLGGGFAIGLLSVPDAWYFQLDKPVFTPPPWVFPPVWTALYAMIAFVGWRVWRRDPQGAAIKLWWGQLAANFLWSPIFFRMHQIGLAFAMVLTLLVAVVAFILTVWRADPLSGKLFVPYAAWVTFAAALNGAILALNPG